MPAMATPWPALVALAAALAIHAELLSRLRRVDGHAPPWWFGYARDGTNLSSVLMLWGAFLLAGFAAPVAFLAANLTTLATYLLDYLFARGLKWRRVRLALTLPLAAWVLVVALRPALVDEELGALIARVEPAQTEKLWRPRAEDTLLP
jgi:hypothetical protein